MKYSCNLIKDILPLYHDKVASDESAEAVEEHLKECAECKKYYNEMCGADYVESLAYDEQVEQKKADSYKMIYKKAVKKVCKIVGVTILASMGLAVAVCVILIGYFKMSASASKEIYEDVSEYAQCRTGETAIKNFQIEAADEIFPKEITDKMDVQDYLMMYYNPFDANYLGYLAVKYEEADYAREVERLTGYPSTDYIGRYGAEGFSDYDVLAMDASDNGFVYAITDGRGMMIYLEMIFPGYGMDIDYEKYIPEKYLPEGLDATEDNPVRRNMIERNQK